VTIAHQSEELDEGTREYLRAVRVAEGRGMPGIFVRQTNYLPVTGFLLGLLIVGMTLLATLPPVGNPINEAMLQTAGIMLGGWMVVAAFRVWTGRNSPRHIGHFLYVDPLNVWDAYESWVKVTPIGGCRGASCQHNTQNGKYSNSTVRLHLSRGAYSFTVSGQRQADEMAAFLNLVAELRDDPGRRDHLSPAVLGCMAREGARHGEYPRHVTSDDLAVAEVPQPQRARRPASNLWRYAVIIALGVGCFFLMRELNPGLRDDALFEEAVAVGRPGLLRGYLIDPRNTRHRNVIQTQLDGFYNDAITHLTQKGGGGDVNKAFCALVETLKNPETPALVVAIRENPPPENAKPAAPPPDDGARGRTEKIRDALKDQLTRRIGEGPASKVQINKWYGEDQVFVGDLNQRVGEELVQFAELKEKGPAQIEVEYAFVRDPQLPTAARIDWTVTLREQPDKAPLVTKSFSRGPLLNEQAIETALTSLTDETIAEMAGREANNPAGIPGLPVVPPIIRPPGGP
jgi:hypothetical protein